MGNVVYHSSPQSGLKELKPQISENRKKWIYATGDIAMCAVFLNRKGGDFTCTIDRDKRTEKALVCERFPGAFDLRYKERRGSIYLLPAGNFLARQTSWSEEYVSERPVKPLREIKILDVAKYLGQLEKEKKLIIFRYPQRPNWIPKDDSDLIKKAVLWIREERTFIWEQLSEYHPRLIKIVEQKLKESS